MQLAMFNGSVVALTTIVHEDAVAAVFGNREADGISGPFSRNSAALPGVTDIAEFPQLSLAGRNPLAASGACATEPGAQRQPPWKRPVDVDTLFGGEEIRTSHNMHILVPIRPHVVDFFVMTEPNRLEMLNQFLEQNPNDAFARYGLALEYSKLGQTDTALQQFNKLLELHPDYTSGYFMAAQTLARAERNVEAKAMLQKGIESARRTGNRHALSEMSAMLEEIS